MEDFNQMAADCIVLSCCCQCLLLQFFIYLFLKLPRTLLHRARKKLPRMRSRKKVETELVEGSAKLGEMFAAVYNNEDSISMCLDIGLLEEFKETSADHNSIINHVDIGEDGHRCIEAIERVLDEYHGNGEFGFGSFWRKEVFYMGSPSSCSSCSSPSSMSRERSTMASSFLSDDSSSSSMMGRSGSGGLKKKKKKKRRELRPGLRNVQFKLIEIVHSLSHMSRFRRLSTS